MTSILESNEIISNCTRIVKGDQRPLLGLPDVSPSALEGKAFP